MAGVAVCELRRRGMTFGAGGGATALVGADGRKPAVAGDPSEGFGWRRGHEAWWTPPRSAIRGRRGRAFGGKAMIDDASKCVETVKLAVIAAHGMSHAIPRNFTVLAPLRKM